MSERLAVMVAQYFNQTGKMPPPNERGRYNIICLPQPGTPGKEQTELLHHEWMTKDLAKWWLLFCLKMFPEDNFKIVEIPQHQLDWSYAETNHGV